MEKSELRKNANSTMSKQRMKELLIQIVDYVSVGNNTDGQIEELLKYGFTADELVNEFNYQKTDVENFTGAAVLTYPEKKYKLHAIVTREIKVTEDQMERLCNHICGCVEHSDIDDIIQAFTEDITSGDGDYESGHIPYGWIDQDFEQVEGEVKEYFDANACNFEDISL